MVNNWLWIFLSWVWIVLFVFIDIKISSSKLWWNICNFNWQENRFKRQTKGKLNHQELSINYLFSVNEFHWTSNQTHHWSVLLWYRTCWFEHPPSNKQIIFIFLRINLYSILHFTFYTWIVCTFYFDEFLIDIFFDWKN